MYLTNLPPATAISDLISMDEDSEAPLERQCVDNANERERRFLRPVAHQPHQPQEFISFPLTLARGSINSMEASPPRVTEEANRQGCKAGRVSEKVLLDVCRAAVGPGEKEAAHPRMAQKTKPHNMCNMPPAAAKNVRGKSESEAERAQFCKVD